VGRGFPIKRKKKSKVRKRRRGQRSKRDLVSFLVIWGKSLFRSGKGEKKAQSRGSCIEKQVGKPRNLAQVEKGENLKGGIKWGKRGLRPVKKEPGTGKKKRD